MLKLGKIGCSALSVSFSPLSPIFMEIWAIFDFSSNSNMDIVANTFSPIVDHLIGVTYGMAAMLMLFVWPWRWQYYVQHMGTSLKSSFVGTSPHLMVKLTSVCVPWASPPPHTHTYIHTHVCVAWQIGTSNKYLTNGIQYFPPLLHHMIWQATFAYIIVNRSHNIFFPVNIIKK